MTKKFERDFEKYITKKTGFILDSYDSNGKHNMCKIKCPGCEKYPEGHIFPEGRGTSISSTPSASNAWNSIKSQIRKVHRENIEKK